MSRRLLAVVIAVTVAVLGGAFLRSRDSRPARPNIVLIVVDTLRRDHVGAYGYGRNTTPAIDAIAAGNVLFANAYANANWTKPSIASLFTGLYVSQHGVKYVVTSEAGAPAVTQALPAEVTTLAETLRSQGYRTIGVVENVHISAKLGFSQGFDDWHENATGAANLTGSVLYRLESVSEPFFLYVHYFDPHAPYYRTRTFESNGAVAPGLLESKSTDLDWSTYTFGVDRGIVGMSSIERERLVDLYDGQVRYVDLGIGRIMADLSKRRLLDNSWIIITSDHGENFGEGGRLTHPHDCFANPQVRVPLVMKMPRSMRVGEVTIADTVQLVDIAPTVMAMLGVEALPGMVGLDLMPAIEGRAVLPQRALPAESESGEMLLAEGHKYIRVPTHVGIFEFLYNMARDPLEESSIAASASALSAHFEKAKAEQDAEARRRQTLSPGEGVALSDEEVQKMRALGYLGN